MNQRLFSLHERNINVKINSFLLHLYNVTSSVSRKRKPDPLLHIYILRQWQCVYFNFANIKMYAGDLSIYAIADNEYDRKALQFELNLFCKWYGKKPCC